MKMRFLDILQWVFNSAIVIILILQTKTINLLSLRINSLGDLEGRVRLLEIQLLKLAEIVYSNSESIAKVSDAIQRMALLYQELIENLYIAFRYIYNRYG